MKAASPAAEEETENERTMATAKTDGWRKAMTHLSMKSAGAQYRRRKM